MHFVETDDARFESLPDYPFAPAYVQVDPSGLRMHHVDVGRRDAPVALLLHGEPTWSYLYRFMIPKLVDRGFRVVAPDLIGFGRSSKPTRVADYTYARHVGYLQAFLDTLGLEGLHLFGQDWGSLVGLRVVGEAPARFASVTIGNGFLPAGNMGKGKLAGLANAAAFLTWRTFAQATPVFPTGRIVAFGTGRVLTPREVYAYDAPFPTRAHLAGARAFPGLVPVHDGDPAVPANRAAWQVLERFERPFSTVFSTGDPITRGLEKQLQRRIPGASAGVHQKVRGGHFLQEDAPDALVEVITETARRAGAPGLTSS